MQLPSFLSFMQITPLFVGITMVALLKAIVLIVIGIIVGKIVSRFCTGTIAKYTPYQSKLVRKIIFYLIFLGLMLSY